MARILKTGLLKHNNLLEAKIIATKIATELGVFGKDDMKAQVKMLLGL